MLRAMPSPNNTNRERLYVRAPNPHAAYDQANGGFAAALKDFVQSCQEEKLSMQQLGKLKDFLESLGAGNPRDRQASRQMPMEDQEDQPNGEVVSKIRAFCRGKMDEADIDDLLQMLLNDKVITSDEPPDFKGKPYPGGRISRGPEDDRDNNRRTLDLGPDDRDNEQDRYRSNDRDRDTPRIVGMDSWDARAARLGSRPGKGADKATLEAFRKQHGLGPRPKLLG